MEKSTLKSEIRFYAIFLACFMAFWTFGYGHYRIPSESMQPTLEVGDRLYVSKFSYGYSRHDIPFGYRMKFLGDGVFNPSLPERGDVVVFRNPKSNMVLIKRCIGLPGDSIEYRQGRLFVNGEMIARAPEDEFLYREHSGRKEPQGRVVKVTQYAEQLPGEDIPHMIYERTDGEYNDQRGPFSVPEGHLFFAGDNRDNSTDSRAPRGPGYVPLDHVIGRAERMVLSFKRCEDEEGLRCPGKRWLIKL
ncbi:MAG: signal peptidase I [Robiginitomaculum sp.]